MFILLFLPRNHTQGPFYLYHIPLKSFLQKKALFNMHYNYFLFLLQQGNVKNSGLQNLHLNSKNRFLFVNQYRFRNVNSLKRKEKQVIDIYQKQEFLFLHFSYFSIFKLPLIFPQCFVQNSLLDHLLKSRKNQLDMAFGKKRAYSIFRICILSDNRCCLVSFLQGLCAFQIGLLKNEVKIHK
ncbi:hypothetical protein IMG5_049390 [Ichthyophthirius multifiliis]|uniref:Uncharacterized protein n=1 Tax=Ichthyophthirius multifiliis TaxID=5932 RepID=G0QMJ7_ICHMU|nr:hypothetical protein IMG5_049390 [Ichthyophthirius multifiliis]EGR33563.1 hypothetical protein IMG5_049390 [Ichthyophthirius multifiliis]|eukprot:XP_004037549.1 hypothetical protein IMG5_049390 [Ichthyophthirius multifiliis]